MLKLLVSLGLLVGTVKAFSEVPSHQLGAAETLRALLENREAEGRLDRSPREQRVQRPYAEYEAAKYVIFDDQLAHDSVNIKPAIAANLPAGITLIVMSASRKKAAAARRQFEQYISGDRLKVIVVPKGETFWARDTTPVPVFMEEGGLGLVETRHRGGQWIAPKILELFPVPFIASEFNYPGGNFMGDTRGNCFQVRSERGYLSEDALKGMYGCKNVVTFKHEHGLGDIDEAAKVVSPNTVLTDEPNYESTFRDLGYTVVRLPRPSQNPRGTYVNSLQVNGTVFLPVYGVDEDEEAISAYRSVGLTVRPYLSNDLSAIGFGSIHCMTMSYP